MLLITQQTTSTKHTSLHRIAKFISMY